MRGNVDRSQFLQIVREFEVYPVEVTRDTNLHFHLTSRRFEGIYHTTYRLIVRLNMSITSAATTRTDTLSAENVIHLVPEVDTQLARSHQRQDSTHNDLEGYDEEQIRLMDEVCIVLDENDNPIGSASKKVCRCTRFPSAIHST